VPERRSRRSGRKGLKHPAEIAAIKWAREIVRDVWEKKPRESKHIMEKGPSQEIESASSLIDAKIQALGGWRGETLARLRALIKQADPEVVEECKWKKPSNPAGTPVWSHDGILCTGETYKSVVKLTFAKGASLEDPEGLFNASLDGNVRRAIDFREGDAVNEEGLKALIRAAVALNTWA
jgi:hypothetical protein